MKKVSLVTVRDTVATFHQISILLEPLGVGTEARDIVGATNDEAET